MILLKRSLVLSLFAAAGASYGVLRGVESASANENCVVSEPPHVHAQTLWDGKLVLTTADSKVSTVEGCCAVEGGGEDDEEAELRFKKVPIGSMPQLTQTQALQVLDSAKEAWNGGSGTWTSRMSLAQRIEAIETLVSELKRKREEIVHVLMWEIGKNVKDAQSEFDRTISFIEQTIQELRTNPEYNASWKHIGSTHAFTRRAAVGIILCLGPFNYPLNETYATLIPALLMGNVVIMKIPTVGGLAHLLSMEAFAKALPPGVINFISGSGRETMPPLMASGSIDGLAFIGGSNAADDLIGKHPTPHRLKLFLQLEAKNMGIFLPNLFEQGNKDQLDVALNEAVTGSLSFNGQRCTALKLLFVPKSNAESVAVSLAKRVESLSVGLPWAEENGEHSKITPLPNKKRVDYMESLIADAISKGAQIMNAKGGSIIGGPESTLMVPAVLYPVTPDMMVYHEEQFGPVVPIAPYDDLETVIAYGQNGKYGQQCSIFTAGGDEATVSIVDRFSSVFGKININSQCGRSPDTLVFSGRRSSAMGVMSVSEALREFSVPTVVAYKDQIGDSNDMIAKEIQSSSQFMQSL